MPFLLHLILFLIPSPALLSHSASVPAESQTVKMVISERCVSNPDMVEGQEVDLTPGSPLVLTHRIRLVPGTASGSCCQSEFAALRERLEVLEREVSELREKCGGLEGGCCTSQQSKGTVYTLRVTMVFGTCPRWLQYNIKVCIKYQTLESAFSTNRQTQFEFNQMLVKDYITTPCPAAVDK